MTFWLCTYVRGRYRCIRRKAPEGVTVYYSLEVAVTKLVTSKIYRVTAYFKKKVESLGHARKELVNRRLLKSAVRVLIHASEAAVPKMGTAKILYMRDLRLFAMYVRTEPVHTYIAKSPKRAICAIHYDTKVVVDILSTTT